MEIFFYRDALPIKWDERLYAAGKEGGFCQSCVWARLVQEIDHARPIFLEAVDNSCRVVASLLLFHKIPWDRQRLCRKNTVKELISEIVYTLPPDKPRILTFSAKWDEASMYYINSKAVCPANISDKEQAAIIRIAKAAFRLTGCRGYARVDLRQDKAGQFKVLEVNPNPDITPGSGAALQAATAGMSYSQFIKKIIHYALN